MKHILYIIIFLLFPVATNADNYKLTASAPSTVETGEQFKVQFTVNTDDASDFTAPSFSGFEVIYGPSTSRQSSFQMVNGHSSHSSSITYTYILIADKSGSFDIGSATVKAGGKTIKSSPLKVTVLPTGSGGSSSRQSNSQSRQHPSQPSRPSDPTGNSISNSDLFITVNASKTHVREQEAVLLTYKVYTLVNLVELDGKLPSLDGFQIQELPLPRNKQFTQENYKGKNYHSVVWSQYVLFPQRTGELEIPALSFTGIVETPNRNMDPFDAIFNGLGGMIETRKKIIAPKLVIHVSALPDKPEDFSGGVGSFSISSSINGKDFKTNDAITLKVNVKGTGNMKLISTPKVDFPKDFEVYDPKINDDFNLTKNGISGVRQFEYLAVPRNPGKYTIPPVTFTFYDIHTNSYKTISTEPYSINITRGKGNSSQAVSDFTGSEVTTLNEDIRYIKTGDSKSIFRGRHYFGTFKYLLSYLLPLLLFLILLAVWRKRLSHNSDTVLVKGRKANKVALKRMKHAEKLLGQNKDNEFYDEVLKALWGYISDKFNIPQESLNKDNISSRLTDHGVDKKLIDDFISTLNECEYARYAPGDPTEAKDKTYRNAVDIISEMESNIKKK